MIGVIADDLTGAAEIGAVGWRHGLRAEVWLGGTVKTDADLICVDTDSRGCTASEAAQRVTAAAKLLRAAGATWIFKKTDSVLRGNVTAELEAVVHQLGLHGALLVPANPLLGRTIVDGKYFVRGRPLHETNFAHDPQHPRLSSSVTELITPSLELPVCVRKPGEKFPASGIVIGEVADAASVGAWAARREDGWLCAGGAEFFAECLRSRGRESAPFEKRFAPTNVGGYEFFVCGSASVATEKFVAAERERGVAVFGLPEKILTSGALTDAAVAELAAQITLTLQAEQRAVLCVGLPLTDGHAEFFGAELVRVAAEVLRHAGSAHVFAEGGATAVALARSLGWTQLRVMDELAPGVATLVVGDNTAQRFTVKPGSYVWPDFAV
ncbi:MAG: hypothetical protein RLZZ350_2053 [Verrucomicrobiota bacterium]